MKITNNTLKQLIKEELSEGMFDKFFGKKKGPTEKEQRILDMFSNGKHIYFGNNMKVDSSESEVKISGTIALVMAENTIEIPVDFSVPFNDHLVSGIDEFIIAVNAPVSFSIEDYYKKKYDANIQFPEDLIRNLLTEGKNKGYTSKLYFHIKDMYKGMNRDMNESKQPNYARNLIKALRNK